MFRFWFLSAVLVFVLFSRGVAAQRCVSNFTGPAQFCKPYVTYPYYLPAGPTEWIIKSLLQYSATSSTLQATFVESTCERKLIPYICGSAFTRCDDKTAPGQVLSRPLCRSVCEDVVEACRDFFQEENLALPNCSQVVKSFTNVKLSNGVEVEVKCFTVDSDLPAPKFPFECGGILDDDPNAEPFPCGVKCPIPIYSKGWQDGTLWYTRIVTPIVSLLLLIFIGIQLYQWKFWMVFPRYYLVYNSFFIFIALIPYLMFALSGGYSEIGCKSKVETANNDVPACNFATWALYIGSWGTNGCFAIICMNILSVITMKNHASVLLYLNLFHHFILFVPPIVILIVTESLGLTGYSPGYGVCYFDPLYEVAFKGGLNGRSGLLFVLNIIPFSITQLWGYICLALTIFLVFRRGGVTALIQQSRLCAFSTFYGASLIYGIVGSYEYLVRGNKPVNEYLICKLSQWINENIRQPVPDCPSGAPSDPAAAFYQNAIAPTVYAFLNLVFFARDCLRAHKAKSSNSHTIYQPKGTSNKSSNKSVRKSSGSVETSSVN